eukprot:TRINITY_DN3275_c0_g1_i4.p1 TRINITY_DN3275_c0_g1~~TRINITY_DN3275_c0_g1_i4.p1  ORF type:complete len:472 (+),score=128.98 TRINITY_DN3275_c0_g1_i4:122-1417(+)
MEESDSDIDDFVDLEELDDSDEDLIEFYGGIDGLDDDDDFDTSDEEDLDADADYIAQLLKSEELGDIDEFTIVDEFGNQHQVSANQVLGANNFTRKARLSSSPGQNEKKNGRKQKRFPKSGDQQRTFDTESLSKKQIKKLKIKEKRARRREAKEAKIQKCTFDDVLKFNSQLQDFVRSSDDSFGFPPVSRKRRYILHRLAGMYRLKSTSFGNGATRYTICYRTAETSIPPQEAISRFLTEFQHEFQDNQFGFNDNRGMTQQLRATPPKSTPPRGTPKSAPPRATPPRATPQKSTPPRATHPRETPPKTNPYNHSASRSSPKQNQGYPGKNKHQNRPQTFGRSLGSNEPRFSEPHQRKKPQSPPQGNKHRQSDPNFQRNPIPAESPSLGSENAGYQILLSMGWQGGGLGVNETGIQGPVPVFVKLDRRGLGC